MISTPNFRQCLKNQSVVFLIYYPLVTALLLPIIFFIYGGSVEDFFEIMKQLFSEKNIAAFFSILMITYLGNVIYAWSRVRNPTYIKKQEAYEKWKAEKESKKSAQSDETES